MSPHDTARHERQHEGPSGPLLTAREAADYLNISDRMLANLRKDGGLQAVRIGRCVRFRLRDLDRWVANHADEGGER